MMAAGPEGMWFVCPECGASNLPNAETCFLCGHRVGPSSPPARPATATATAANPYAPPARVRGGGGFRLDSMLLVIALIAVCMGVIHEAPGLGIPLAVVAFIAWARTVVYTSGRAPEHPVSAGDKLAVFFATVGIALIVLLCVVIALFATCLAICAVAMPGAKGGITGLGSLSIPVILVAAVGLVWVLMRSAGRLGRVRQDPRDRPGRPG